MVKPGRRPSLILWGPPGSGKTTLARLLADRAGGTWRQLSAVTSGVADIRSLVAEAKALREAGGAMIAFIDELHRFNKSQQDALLPHVEEGTISLIGATTEDPYYGRVGVVFQRGLAALAPCRGAVRERLLLVPSQRCAVECRSRRDGPRSAAPGAGTGQHRSCLRILPARPSVSARRRQGKAMRHRWWHDAITGQFYAVATNERGEIVSAWMQVDRRVNRWEAIDELDGFGPLERARKRGEIHVNTDPHGYTDELGPSIEEPVQ